VVAPPAEAQFAAGGMEYATLFTAYARRHPVDPRDILLWEVTLHEAGHGWWQGMVASNEFEEAWLDEGLTTWATDRAMESVGLRWNVAEVAPSVLRGALAPFLRTSLSDLDLRALALRPRSRTPVALPGWQFPDAGATGQATYERSAASLATLERALGRDRFDRMIRTYAERYAFRHPGTDDFLAVVGEAGGPELHALARAMFRGTDGLDDSVRSIRCGHETGEPEAGGAWRCDVDVDRAGALPIPCTLRVVFDDGTQVTEEVRPGTPWQRFTYRRTGDGARVREARVHPAGAVPVDANPTNDARTRARTPGPLAGVGGWFLYAAQLVAAAVGTLL
jgi:hypothetical protein